MIEINLPVTWMLYNIINSSYCIFKHCTLWTCTYNGIVHTDHVCKWALYMHFAYNYTNPALNHESYLSQYCDGRPGLQTHYWAAWAMASDRECGSLPPPIPYNIIFLASAVWTSYSMYMKFKAVYNCRLMWLQYIGPHQMAPKATLHARHNLWAEYPLTAKNKCKSFRLSLTVTWMLFYCSYYIFKH